MPKQVDHTLRRAEIAEIAAKIIAELGLEKATIREVAKRSGFSKSIVENYFESKEELIHCALEWANQKFNVRVEQAVSKKSGLAAVRARMESILPTTNEKKEEWRIRLQFWCMASLDKELQKKQEHRYTLSRQYFLKDLQAAKKNGELAPNIIVADEASKLTHMVSGLSVATLNSPHYFNERRVNETINKYIRDLKPHIK